MSRTRSHPVTDTCSVRPGSGPNWNDPKIRKDALIGHHRHILTLLDRIDELNYHPYITHWARAENLRLYRPDVVPPGYGDPKLAVIFSYYWYHDSTFRSQYHSALSDCGVPTDPSVPADTDLFEGIL